MTRSPTNVPLVVDLDGTLTPADTTTRQIIQLMTRQPGRLRELRAARAQGKAEAKWFLWNTAGIDVERLPWSRTLQSWLLAQAQAGRTVVLATGAPWPLAEAVAERLAFIDEILASSRQTNLTGETKARLLETRFGYRGFDYVGNGEADLPIWRIAKHAYVANATSRLAARAIAEANVVACFDDRRYRGPRLGRAILRIAGWQRAKADGGGPE